MNNVAIKYHDAYNGILNFTCIIHTCTSTYAQNLNFCFGFSNPERQANKQSYRILEKHERWALPILPIKSTEEQRLNRWSNEKPTWKWPAMSGFFISIALFRVPENTGSVPFLNWGHRSITINTSHVKRGISLETGTQGHIVLWTFNTDDIKPGPWPGQALGSPCYL